MVACPAEEGGGRSLGIVDKPGGEQEHQDYFSFPLNESTRPLSEFPCYRSPRWASVSTEIHPGSVPQSRFGFSIGTNI
jgi:hypothetical protein